MRYPDVVHLKANFLRQKIQLDGKFFGPKVPLCPTKVLFSKKNNRSIKLSETKACQKTFPGVEGNSAEQNNTNQMFDPSMLRGKI